ncbi:MAG: G8 domain-containing protein [Actinomycetota bacterium]
MTPNSESAPRRRVPLALAVTATALTSIALVTSPSRASGPEISGFEVIDPIRDVSLGELVDGSYVDRVPSDEVLNIRAVTSGEVGSVAFRLDGETYRVENVEPYALAGDRDGDYSTRWSPEPGTYAITAEAFAGPRATGDLLDTATVEFTVGDGPAPAPPPPGEQPEGEPAADGPPPIDTAPGEPPTTDSGDDHDHDADAGHGDHDGHGDDDSHGDHEGHDGHDHGTDGPTHEGAAWSDPATWPDGAVPVAGEDVTVPADATIFLDESTASLGDVVVHGRLVFGDTDATLTAANVVVAGELRAGTPERPHAADARIVLTGHSSDPDLDLTALAHGGHHDHDDHPDHGDHADQHGTVHNKALVVTTGGSLELHGSPVTSWTQVDATIDAGQSTLDLVEPPTGWHVGDRIVVAPTDFFVFEIEERTITAIDGARVTVDEPFEHLHFGEIQDVEGRALDMRAEVANLSRNITITGTDEGESRILFPRRDPDNYSRVGYGGHVVVLPGATARISGVEFAELGLSGHLGGYPLHFHHTGDASASYVRDSAIHHSFQRGLVVHRTDNLRIERNVVFDTMSHSFFIEDGVEVGNQFIDNLAMLPRETTNDLRIDNPNRTSRGEERPSGFWITNPSNAFVGNHAVAIPQGQGFWFVEPDNASRTGLKKKAPEHRLPLLEFSDNTAHTVMFEVGSAGNLGYRFDWTGNALDLGAEVWTQDANAPIERFTAWKIGNHAIHIAPNRTIEIIEPTIAEARVMIHSDRRGIRQYEQPLPVLDAVLLTTTDNTAPGRTNVDITPKKFRRMLIAEPARPVVFDGLMVVGDIQLQDSKRDEHAGMVVRD